MVAGALSIHGLQKADPAISSHRSAWQGLCHPWLQLRWLAETPWRARVTHEPPHSEPCNVATPRKEGETDSQQLHWQRQDVGGGRAGCGGEEEFSIR